MGSVSFQAEESDFEDDHTQISAPGLLEELRRTASDLASKPSLEPDLVEWFVAIDDEPIGPVTRERVRGFISMGKLNSENLCWREGYTDWIPLRKSPELSTLLGGSRAVVKITAPPPRKDRTSAPPPPAAAPSQHPPPRDEAPRGISSLRGQNVGRLGASPPSVLPLSHTSGPPPAPPPPASLRKPSTPPMASLPLPPPAGRPPASLPLPPPAGRPLGKPLGPPAGAPFSGGMKPATFPFAPKPADSVAPLSELLKAREAPAPRTALAPAPIPMSEPESSPDPLEDLLKATSSPWSQAKPSNSPEPLADLFKPAASPVPLADLFKPAASPVPAEPPLSTEPLQGGSIPESLAPPTPSPMPTPSEPPPAHLDSPSMAELAKELGEVGVSRATPPPSRLSDIPEGKPAGSSKRQIVIVLVGLLAILAGVGVTLVILQSGGNGSADAAPRRTHVNTNQPLEPAGFNTGLGDSLDIPLTSNRVDAGSPIEETPDAQVESSGPAKVTPAVNGSRDKSQGPAQPAKGNELTAAEREALAKAAAMSDESTPLVGAGRTENGTSEIAKRGQPLSGEQIRSAVAKNRSTIQRCYERDLRGARGGGDLRVMIRVTIRPTGTVSNVRITPDNLRGSALGQCIDASVRRWRFPNATADTIVEVPFLLTPGN